MRVLFFIRSLVVGGSQRQLVMLAEGLARRGHDVAAVVFYTGDEIETARGPTALRVLPLAKSSRWDVIGPLRRLRRLLRTEQPDVVYAFQPTQTALAALLLPRQSPTRLIFGIRAAGTEVARYDTLSAVTHRLEAWLSRRADLIIANAEAGLADAIKRGMPADRIAVVPNGIDTDVMRPDPDAGRALRRRWGISADAFVIGCVARLDPMKDHSNFLTAAARLAVADAGVRFVCVGGGAAGYRQQLQALARSLGLEHRVVWTGEIADVKAAYNAFDIATLASAFGEGFPNVVGEAMACGIPVVATDVGDVRAIVGEHGEVVSARSPELLCLGWTRLRQRLTAGTIARERMRDSIVARYGVVAMIGRTEDMLTKLAAGRPMQEVARKFD